MNWVLNTALLAKQATRIYFCTARLVDNTVKLFFIQSGVGKWDQSIMILCGALSYIGCFCVAMAAGAANNNANVYFSFIFRSVL